MRDSQNPNDPNEAGKGNAVVHSRMALRWRGYLDDVECVDFFRTLGHCYCREE